MEWDQIEAAIVNSLVIIATGEGEGDMERKGRKDLVRDKGR